MKQSFWRRTIGAVKQIPFISSSATCIEPTDEKSAPAMGAVQCLRKPREQQAFLDIIAQRKTGQPFPPRKPALEETVHLKEYNEALIQTVEDKFAELESARVSLDCGAAGRKRMAADLCRSNRMLVMINACNHALVHSTDEMQLLREFCRLIIKFGGHRLVWAGYAEDDEKKTVRPVVWTGDDEYIARLNITWADVELGRGPVGRAIREQRPAFVQNIETDPSFAPWRAAALERGYRSVISLPLLWDGRAFGVLSIYAPIVDAFNAEEIRLLVKLADDMAYGITTLRSRAEHAQDVCEIEALAKFPSENPNMVMRVTPGGVLLYANLSSAPVLAWPVLH